MSTETREQQGWIEIVTWRRDQLVRSGFSLSLAALVAWDQRYDIHRLIELVERGCDAELAVRILAPLEEQEVM